jgi:lysophospholipase L1-like esterase
MWGFRVPLVVLGAVFALALPLAAAAKPGHEKYVLALGDSWTAGTQPIAQQVVLGGSPDLEVNRSGEGYADQIVSQLNAEGEKVKLVNLACYYETTTMMIEGGGLCSYPHGSQLDEAVQFLHAHGEHVRAVVMTMGVNDGRDCGLFDAGCHQSRLATASANLATILAQLRDEDGDVPIAMPNYNNPLLVTWFQSPALAAYTNTLFAAVSAMLATTSAPYDVTLVDTLSLFQTFDFTSGPGGIPVNVGMVCAYSWMCTWNDSHLNADGYALAAEEVRAALGI